ncbi:MAG TPA: biotin/lipoyl-containing protein [Pseudomonadales bacterium]|jgi:acetyl-CoA carboxylase biotin carboxyl carrier protein|nr:biotin/lipoyl-containing protein [Pseudomonadales bacterium]
MDLRKIKKLIDMVEESGISELEVRTGEESIRIARPLLPKTSAPSTQEASAPPRQAAPRTSRGFIVRAPLTGTFYCAPAPGERPFVRVDQTVEVGDVLCIIESMKMMNQIEAERAGRIAEVNAEDASPVETGTPLFRIE